MLEYLPQEPDILVSTINMLLRDHEFDSLEDICSYYGKDTHTLIDYLRAAGFTFDETAQTFK